MTRIQNVKKEEDKPTVRLNSKGATQEKLLALIRERGSIEGMTLQEIADLIGVPHRWSVLYNLRALDKKGLIKLEK